MLERARDLTRAAVAGFASLLDGLRRQVDAWVQGGDTTVMVVMVAIALVLLLFIVVPSRRRY